MRFLLDKIPVVLDMYSPRRLPRFTSWALLVFAVASIAVSAPSVSLLGVAVLGLLLGVNRERFLLTIDDLLARHDWLIVVLPLLIVGAAFVMEPPIAQDDLLRHIVAASWPAGYADMYVHVDPTIEIGDPYWGFDLVAGKLGMWLGPRMAMWLIQLAAWIAFASVFCLVGLRLLGGRQQAMALVMIALVLSLQITGSRLFLGRPEIFMAIWVVAAAAVRSPVGGLAWLVTGAALISGYYLAPIYFASALLLPFRWAARFLAVACLLVIWAVVWGTIEGSALGELLYRPIVALVSQYEGARIGENAGILGWVASPTMLALLLGAMWSVRCRGAKIALLSLAGYFAMSNQLRFGALVAPLLALFVLSGFRDVGRYLPRHSSLVVLVFSTVSLLSLASTISRDGTLPSFQLPSGAVVLTALDEATYSLPFENPGRIRVAPIFDIGMIAPDARTVVMKLANGQVDCEAARRLGFSHVVEDSLRGAPPDCLRLVQRQGAWSLWAVH